MHLPLEESGAEFGTLIRQIDAIEVILAAPAFALCGFCSFGLASASQPRRILNFVTYGREL